MTTAMLLVALATVLLPGGAAAAAAPKPRPQGFSKLWGKNGELYDPAGPLFDFSFAGYKQGEPLPTPPATRSVTDWRHGRSDTEMFKAALAWANNETLTDAHIVLTIPPGRFTVTEQLNITRSRVVLRGAGRTKTSLYLPKSMTDLYGPYPMGTGGYVFFGGLVSVRGVEGLGAMLTQIISGAKGSKEVQVSNSSGLQVGQRVDLRYTDVDGKFNNAMYNDLLVAPSKYAGQQRVDFATRITAIKGKTVTLERGLPYAIAKGINVVIMYRMFDTVHDSGVEGMTFHFKWAPYAGHHLEKGYNAIEFVAVRDCWARDIRTINADSGVLINTASAVTVSGIRMQVSRTRKNDIPNAYDETTNSDGHWGVQYTHSFDVLMEKFDIRCTMMHDMGTGSSGKFGVFQNGVMTDGNLDLHRALSGPTLYTNIDVGVGRNALYSGGPGASGPNAAAGTTWWNIRGSQAVDPPRSKKPAGDCSFGPALNLVNVNIIPSRVPSMCKTWHFERRVKGPANLYYAQVQRRKQLAAAGAGRR